MESQQDIRTCRAVPSAYMAMGLVWWALFGMAVYIAVARPEVRNTWQMLLLTGGAVALVHAWLGAFRLEFGDGWIRYRSLLQRTREIRLDDIAGVNHASTSKTKLSPYGIEILVQSGEGIQRTVINAKVFNREALKQLRESLAPFVSAR